MSGIGAQLDRLTLREDFTCVFIVPHAFKNGMPEMTLPRPFCKPNPADQGRFKPDSRLSLDGGQAVTPGAAVALGNAIKGTFTLPQTVARSRICLIWRLLSPLPTLDT